MNIPKITLIFVKLVKLKLNFFIALGIVTPWAETCGNLVLLFIGARLRFMRLDGNDVNRAAHKI